ncbi:MAG: class I SAM-dependent methyltransferase [Proteobacteria bacterium]|nr:class I SAM-dependent methyltransferase [Pseudomonadota bacterium]
MPESTIYEDGTYLENNPTWHQEDSPWKAAQITKMLRRHDIIPSSVCEIGCGAGEILACLAAEYGDEVMFTGYEISPQAFKLAKTKVKNNLQFFLKDFFDDQGADFELVMAIDVFEHVEDYFGFLRGMRVRGRYHVFHIPLDLSVQALVRGTPIIGGRTMSGHLHYFNKDTALATLKDTGYEIVDYFYTSGFELPKGSLRNKLLRTPRRLLYAINPDFGVRMLGGFSLLVLTRSI